MALIRVVQDNFNQGELGPFMLARYDNNLYAAGSLKVENWMLLPHGGITRRPGFQNIDNVGPLVAPPPPPGDGGGGGLTCSTWSTPTSDVFTYSFIAPFISLNVFDAPEWYNTYSWASSLFNDMNFLTPDGMRPVNSGFLVGAPVVAQAGGTIVVGGVVQLPSNAPQYGMLSFDTGNNPWGCSIEIHNVQGPGDIFVGAANANGSSGTMQFQHNTLIGGYNFFAYNVAALSVGEYYTMHFQVKNIVAGNLVLDFVCFYLNRSTDGFWLKIDDVLGPIFTSSPVAVGHLLSAYDIPLVRYTNLPLPGSSSVSPSSSFVYVNYTNPEYFTMGHPVATMTVKNLKVYNL